MKPEEDTRPDVSRVTIVLEEVTATSANVSPDGADETAAKIQDGGAEATDELKEEWVVDEEEEEEAKEMVVEVEEEEENKVQEAPSDDRSQEEQPSGQCHCDEAADEGQLVAQSGPESRSVARH